MNKCFEEVVVKKEHSRKSAQSVRRGVYRNVRMTDRITGAIILTGKHEVPGESISQCGGETPRPVSFLFLFCLVSIVSPSTPYLSSSSFFLFFFLFMSLLSEMQADEAWEPSKKLPVFWKRKVVLPSRK
jgi:hypothetical protein